MKNISFHSGAVPLDTVKQALAQVLEEQSSQTVVHINFTGDLAQLARLLKPEIDVENSRRGSSLGKGMVL